MDRRKMIPPCSSRSSDSVLRTQPRSTLIPLRVISAKAMAFLTCTLSVRSPNLWRASGRMSPLWRPNSSASARACLRMAR